MQKMILRTRVFLFYDTLVRHSWYLAFILFLFFLFVSPQLPVARLFDLILVTAWFLMCFLAARSSVWPQFMRPLTPVPHYSRLRRIIFAFSYLLACLLSYYALFSWQLFCFLLVPITFLFLMGYDAPASAPRYFSLVLHRFICLIKLFVLKSSWQKLPKGLLAAFITLVGINTFAVLFTYFVYWFIIPYFFIVMPLVVLSCSLIYSFISINLYAELR